MMKWNKKTQRVTAWILLFVLCLTDARISELFSTSQPFAVWADTEQGSSGATGSDASEEVAASAETAAEEEELPEILELLEIPMEYILTDVFSVVLQWNLLEMHEGTYRVSVNGEVLDETMGDIYETERLEPGMLYEYQVEAVDSDGEVTGKSAIIEFTAPDVLHITGNVTLNESKNVYALSIAKNASLNLNGYSLRTYADSEILGTLTLAEGALYQQGDLSFSETSQLVMTKTNDYLEVKGDFFLSSKSSWKQLTAGRIELYGDFWQETKEGFVAGGTHRVILKGEQEQTVALAQGSQFAILELLNSSEEGVLFANTLVALELIDHGCPFRMGQENHYYGRKLEEDTQIAGDYMLMGGELDLNGYSLEVDGNFIHASGKVIPNTGVLSVSGNYLLGRLDDSEGAEEKEEEERYLQGSGILLMENAEDRVEIAGNFYFASKADHRTNLKAGELSIGGNLIIGSESGNGALYGSGTHRFILNGSEDQQVNLVQAAGLVLEKEEGIVNLEKTLTIITYLDTKEVVVTGNLTLGQNAEVLDQVLKVDTVTFGSNRIQREALIVEGNLALSGSNQLLAPIEVGKNLLVYGNVTQNADISVGQHVVLRNNNSSHSTLLYTIQSGLLEVEGDFSQDRTITPNYAYLVMNATSIGKLLIHGDMWHTSSSMRTLAGGIIEVEGDIYMRNLTTTGETRLILSGTDRQEVDAVGCIFALIELNNYSEEGVWSAEPLAAGAMIMNGCTLRYGDGTGDFGWTLAEDEVISRDMDLVGGILNLNGQHLTVQGNFTHSGGTIIYQGGSLTVEGDYTARAKQQVAAYSDGMTIVKGDFWQEGSSYLNFMSSGTHVLVLAGTEMQRVSLEAASRSNGIQIGSLRFTNTSSEGVVVASDLYVTVALDGAGQKVSGLVTLGPNASLIGNQFSGDLFINHPRSIPIGCEADGNITLVLSGAYAGTIKTGGNLRLQGSGSLDGAVEVNQNLVVAGTVSQKADVLVGGNFDVVSGSWTISEKADLKVGGNLSSGTTSSSSYSLRMTHPEALVQVDGSLNVRGGNFNQGRLELKGNGVFYYLKTGTDFVLYLNGSEPQMMTVSDTSANLGILDLRNTSETGVTFSSMVEIGQVISNGCRLQIGDLEGSFGWQLTEDMELEDLTLIGGTLDLNGYHLTINGDLIQSGGTVRINGGTLDVLGNYNMAGSRAGETGRGVLVMEQTSDQVLVSGNFVIDSSTVSTLTHGVLSLAGNFTKTGSGKDFVTSQEHILLMTGGGSQTVTFERSVSGVSIANLEVEKTAGEVELRTYVIVTKSLTDSQSRLRGSVTIQPGTVFPDSEFMGNVTISSSGEVLSPLNVNGNLTLSGTITVKAAVSVNGNLSLSGTIRTEARMIVNGTLGQTGTWYVGARAEIGMNATFGGTIQTNASDAYLLMKSNVTHYTNSNVSVIINQGVFEVQGDLGNSNSRLGVLVSGDGMLIMSGTAGQNLGVTNSSEIGLLDLRNSSANGINLLGIMTIGECRQNGVRVTYLGTEVQFGWRLSGDQELTEDLVLFGGTLDLNGHQLTVDGNLIQMAGAVNINKGTLRIKQDYRMQTRSQNQSGVYQYGQSNALVTMKHSEDRIQVEGNLYTYTRLAAQCVFTDGVLELKGDYWQYNGSLPMSGEHTMKFSGNTRQKLYGSYGYTFGNLLLSGAQGIENERLTAILTISGKLIDETGAVNGGSTVSVRNGSCVEGGAFSGNLVVREAWELEQDYQIGGTLELSAKTVWNGYTIRAKSLQASNQLDIGGGELFLSGNLQLNRYATLIMQGDGYVLIRGDLVFDSYNSNRHTLTAGTIELCGNLTHVGSSTFESGGTHRVILAGKQIEPGRMYVQEIKGAAGLYLNTLVLRRREELYLFTPAAETLCRELIREIIDDTAPAAPLLLRSTGQSETTVNLSWRANTEEDLLGYEIYRDDRKVGVSGRNLYTDMGLKPETEYQYRVTAFDEQGNTSSYSGEIIIRTSADETAPTAPGAPWASLKTGSGIGVSWLASKDQVGIDKYEIIRNGEVLGETTDTYYKDSDVETEVLYTYQIIAIDAAGNRSEPGTVVSSAFAPNILQVSPAAGSRLSGSQVELKVIFADWGNSKGNKVKMEYRHSSHSDWQPVNSASLSQKVQSSGKLYASLWFEPGTLTEDGEYLFRYTLTDADGNSTDRTVSYLFYGAAPAAPANLWASTSQQVIDLGWEVSESAACEGYRIYRQTGEEDWSLLATVAGRYENSYRDEDITGDQEYQYQITSYNDVGRESLPGNTVTILSSVDTWPPSITSILPQEMVLSGAQVIRITGLDNRRIETIRMEYRLAGEQDWILVGEKTAANNVALFFWDTRLLADGEYEVQAFAKDAAGNESAAAFVRSYTVDNTGPAQVVISEVVVGDYNVQVRWLDAADEDTAYFVAELYQNGSKIRTFNAGAVLGVTLSDLMPETTYEVRVTAYDRLDNAGESSLPVSFTTGVDRLNPVIRQVGPAAGTYRSAIPLYVVGSDNHGLSKAVFSYSLDEGETWVELEPVMAAGSGKEEKITTSLDISELPEGLLLVRFEVYDKAGNHNHLLESGDQVIVAYEIDRQAPDAPDNLQAEGTDGYILLTWDSGEEEDLFGYEIYRCDQEEGIYRILKSQYQSRTYYDTAVSPGASYQYYVCAIDQAGNRSEKSRIVVGSCGLDRKEPRITGIEPLTESYVGANPRIAVVAWDEVAIEQITLSYRPEGSDGGFYQLAVQTFNDKSGCLRTTWDTEGLDEGRYEFLVTARDRAGNEAQPATFVYQLDVTAPAVPELEAINGDLKIQLVIQGGTEEDFKEYEIWRRPSEGGANAGWKKQTTTKQGTWTDTAVEGGLFYDYKVFAYDLRGNYSESEVATALARDVDLQAPKALASEYMLAIAGKEVAFDGGQSTDNKEIASYVWDFGNSVTSDGVRPVHTYSEPGVYSVLLEVTDSSGNVGQSRSTVEVFAEGSVGSALVTVQDRSGKPIPYAWVYLKREDGSGISMTADSQGRINIAGAAGVCEVAAYMTGYLPSSILLHLSPYAVIEGAIVLDKGDLIIGDLTVQRMELEEMIEAGVDFSNPSNYHRYKFRFTVFLEEAMLPIEIEYIGGSGGGDYVLSPSGGAGHGGWVGGGSGGGGAGGGWGGLWGQGDMSLSIREVAPEEDLEEEIPMLAFVTTTQSFEWMMEMYKVELSLLNAAAPQYIIHDTVATLDIPEGMSFAALTTGSQSRWAEMGDIAGQEQARTTWVVRGEKSGSYEMNANVRGTLLPFGAPVSASFQTRQEINVQTGEGLHLYIKPQSAAYIGENYYIQFELRNESDRNIYNQTTSFGDYAWEEERVEWVVHDLINGGEYVVGSHIDEEGNRQEGAVFVRTDLNKSMQVTMTTGGDSITAGVLAPGDVLYGTYYQPFIAPGDPDEVYYRMVEYMVEELEGENLGVKVTVEPIQSHILKGILELRPASVYGDPVDVTTGAYVDEIEALSVTGGSTIGLDLSYNSLQAKTLYQQREKAKTSPLFWQIQGHYVARKDAWKGETGIGFTHGYETRLYDDLGVIELATGAGNSLFYMSEDILNHKVYGRVSGREIILDENAPYEGKYFCQNAGMEQSVLEKLADGTYVLYGNRGDEITFDADGRMTGISQVSGKSISLSYGNATMTVRENISGKTVTYYYNIDGLIAYVEDENGRRTTLSYEDGLLTGITNPSGETMCFTYENGLLVKGANHLGEAFVSNTYDETGRVTSQSLGSGESQSQFSYQLDGQGTTVKTMVTDHLGNQMVSVMDGGGRLLSQSKNGETSRYEYNAKGQLIKETTPSGNVILRTYDEWANIASMTDGDGHQVRMEYDRQGNLLAITDGLGSTSRSTYNSLGQMTENRDALGKVTRYTYDSQGNLLTEHAEGLGTTTYGYTDGLLSTYTDRNGNTLQMEYNSTGDMVRAVDATGAVTSYTYDNRRRVLSTTDALGNVTRYEYNEYGQISRQIDASGAVVTCTYDTSGWLKQEVYPDGSSLSYEYDSEGRVIKLSTHDGREFSYSYDASGNLISMTGAEGEVYTYGYTPGGYQTSMVNPRGYDWRATYTQGGLMNKQSFADGSYETYAYNGRTQITQKQDASGAMERYEYDAAGNLTCVTNALGHSIRYTYDIYGRMVKMIDPRGGETTYAYDAMGNCTEKITPGQTRITMEYNSLGQVTALISTVGGQVHRETFTYDALGRLIAKTDAEGYTTRLEYDQRSNVTAVIDALGQRISTVQYDSMNRAVTSEDALGIETAYSYDSAGNLIAQVEAGRETSYSYDKNGRLLQVTDSLGGVTSQTLDAVGNVLSLTDAMGGESHYTYDSMNRMVSETNAIGLTRSYSYNNTGRLECVTAEDGTRTYYQYDLAGFLTEKRDDLGSVRYTYDANGNLLSVSDESGTIQRTYDADNRMVSQTDAHGRTIAYGYDELGNVISLTYPGGAIIRYAYYKNGWLKAVSDQTGTLSEYTYDGNGRILTVSNRNGTKESRSYDAAGKLITLAVTRTNSIGEAEPVYDYTYSYDQYGNITSLTGKQEELSAITQAQMRYDDQNRLIRYNGQTVRYDDRGNMVYGPLKGVMTDFTYDVRNRLIEAGGTRYLYDGEDNRIQVETDDWKEEYTIDVNAALSRILEIRRYEASGVGYAAEPSQTIVCVYGAELILEKKETSEGTTAQYHHHDQIGSTMALTSETGAILTEYSYGAYGELLRGDKGLTRFRYNGGYGVVTDDNGLYHMRARYYNVDIRRFVNQDILRGTLTNSQSLNRYSYVQGNPLSYSDPFGLSPYQTFSAIGHQILDIAGFAPGFGEIADVINAAWYAGEAIYYGLTGNHEMMMRSLKGMGCSLLSALPGIGSFIGQGMKMTIKGVDVGCTIIKGSKMIGYGASAVMAGYGSINGGLDMYRKYAVNGEQMGWHTFGEAGSVALMGVAAVGSGSMATSAVRQTKCFTGDTLVATDEGAKPIEMIKEGDVVLSEDAETGEQSYQSVVQIFISESDTLIHVVTGEDEIEATAMHPFYVIGRGFVPAGELEAGDWLKDSQGRVVEVVDVWIEALDEPVLVYNLEVEETHTYYVGTGMVLVHNNCYGLGGTTPKPGDSDFVGPLPDKGTQNTGRGRNNIKPDPNALGDHSVFKVDSVTGEVTNYKTYKTNPLNPSGFDEVIGYDGIGKAHVNKATGESLMPHIHDKTVPGGVRLPKPYEIPNKPK